MFWRYLLFNGCNKVITGDCGFMMWLQELARRNTKLPVTRWHRLFCWWSGPPHPETTRNFPHVQSTKRSDPIEIVCPCFQFLLLNFHVFYFLCVFVGCLSNGADFVGRNFPSAFRWSCRPWPRCRPSRPPTPKRNRWPSSPPTASPWKAQRSAVRISVGVASELWATKKKTKKYWKKWWVFDNEFVWNQKWSYEFDRCLKEHVKIVGVGFRPRHGAIDQGWMRRGRAGNRRVSCYQGIKPIQTLAMLYRNIYIYIKVSYKDQQSSMMGQVHGSISLNNGLLCWDFSRLKSWPYFW